MIADVDVFGLPMVQVIDQERLRTIVVGGYDERQWAVNLELLKRLMEPDPFLNGTCEGDVLGLSGGNAILLLCRPTDGSSSNGPYKPRDGSAIFLVASPVRI